MEKVEVDKKDLNGILICALRYSLGRRTYIVGDTCRWIKGLLPSLAATTLTIMITDIEEQERFGYGDPCDLQNWMDLLAVLKEAHAKAHA